jgi:hypothetical protein
VIQALLHRNYNPTYLQSKTGLKYKININSLQLPREDVKYLGLHLDRRLLRHKHIFAKRKQLGNTLTNMHCLLRRKSKLSTNNKLLICKTILKPICTYGIQLWGTASTSNIEILEHFQSKALRMMVDEPWYAPNTVIQRDLHIPIVKEEIRQRRNPPLQLSILCSPQQTSNCPNSKPH